MQTRIASFALAILLLAACDDSSTSSTDSGTNQPPAGSDPGTNTTNPGTNTANGFDLVYDFALRDASHAYAIQRDTSRYCDDDTLRSEIDLDTNFITLSSNDLIADDHADTMVQNGSVYRHTIQLHRVGSGTGFQGTWTFHEVLTPLPGLDASNYEEEGEKAFDSVWVTITSTQVIQHISKFHYGIITRPMARQFASIPGVTLTYSSDSSQVDISSPKTTEKVTVKATMEKSGPSITFSSTNPSHGSVTMNDKPTSCPEQRMPSWITDFMIAASGAKSASISLPKLPSRF